MGKKDILHTSCDQNFDELCIKGPYLHIFKKTGLEKKR